MSNTSHFVRPHALLLCIALAIAVPPSAYAQPSWLGASRFVEQSSFGPTWESIARVQEIGFEAYLQEQKNEYPWDYEERDPLYPVGRNNTFCPANSECHRDVYTLYQLQKHFFQNALYGRDQLRQRMAWALSQILVTSGRDLNNLSAWMQPYQQILYSGAFGNYFGLLYNVTLNPAMGNYLDMVNNRCQARVPADPAICRNGQVSKPNENYAREILQLFSIGLYQLNPDGTVQTDEGGNPIPSYTQETIEEFSRVFTGWVFAPVLTVPADRGGGTTPNYRDPMVVSMAGGQPQYHDNGPKTLLNGLQLSGGMGAAEELNWALYNIITHQNVGPFISTLLIQKLVTSNPSPAYVGRVAAVFTANLWSDDQLFQVARAILLDPEARNDFPTDPNTGHLREPVLFMTAFLRAFYAASFDGTDISDGVLNYIQNLGGSYLIGSAEQDQDVFRAPTVFNFYSPEFQVPLEPGVLGPEFEIYTSMMALRRSNFITRVVNLGIPTLAGGLLTRPNGTAIDLSGYAGIASDVPLLVDVLNYLLLGGAMSDAMRTIVVNHVGSIPANQPLQRARDAVFLVATSPAYQVER